MVKNTNSKSANKKQSLLSKINFRSTKVRILITVLAFAVLGGGYLVLQSSASTGAGGYHTCQVRTSDATLWCWGDNYYGQLGIAGKYYRSTPTQVPINNVKQVSTGDHHTCATKTDGTLWCWGSNRNGQLGIGNTTNQTSPKQLFFRWK